MLTLLAFERLLNEYGIELHTIEGHLDTSSPDGFMNYAMRAFLGEMERRQVKYRTKAAMKYNKSQNNVVGGVPFGYTRNGNQLEENPDEQKTIILANGMYKKGMNLTQICRKLNSKGITTRNKKPFRAMQVKRLISGYENIYKKKSTKNGLIIKNFITQIA